MGQQYGVHTPQTSSVSTVAIVVGGLTLLSTGFAAVWFAFGDRATHGDQAVANATPLTTKADPVIGKWKLYGDSDGFKAVFTGLEYLEFTGDGLMVITYAGSSLTRQWSRVADGRLALDNTSGHTLLPMFHMAESRIQDRTLTISKDGRELMRFERVK